MTDPQIPPSVNSPRSDRHLVFGYCLCMCADCIDLVRQADNACICPECACDSPKEKKTCRI